MWILVETTDVHLRVPNELLASVDAARGDVTRSRFVLRAVEQALAPTRSGADLDSYPLQPKPPIVRAPAKQSSSPLDVERGYSRCDHPVTRRIGDGCGVCGQTVRR